MTLLSHPVGARTSLAPTVRLLLSRLIGGVFVVIVVSFAMFSFIHVAPGGPEQALAGQFASQRQLAEIRAAYHLDDPFLVQYGRYVTSLLQFDLGDSFSAREPVTTALWRAASISLPLMLASWAISVVVGTFLGVFTAMRRGSALDRAIGSSVVVGASMPLFATAVLLTWFFGIELGWLPIVGSGDGGMDTVRHLVLPAAAIVTVLLAAATKIARASVLEVLDEDHVVFARARGFSSGYVLRREVLRNAAVPLITEAGTLLVALAGGQVVLEAVFGLDGIGTLLIEAITARDVPLIQAVTLVLAVFIVLVNLFVDFVVLAMDPRIRKGVIGRD